MGSPTDEGNGPDEARSAPSNSQEEVGGGSDQQPVTRRFLGAQSAVAPLRPRWPAWFRTFLLATALVVSGLALVVLVSWLRARPAKETLLTVVVDDYVSPQLPAIKYARQDALRMHELAGEMARRTSSAAPRAEIARPRDKQDFHTFATGTLAEAPGSTTIIYLIAHGWSDTRTAYLLPAAAQPGDPRTGYPIADLLQALVDCPSQNIMLLLDTNRIQADLRIGMLGNDFTHHLQNAFRALRPAAGKNLVIVCTSDAEQGAWSSQAARGSPFCAAVRYCLSGGPLADTSGARRQRPDQVVSARELAQFVQRMVADWSLVHRGTLQQPVILRHGNDFVLRDVDRAITTGQFLADADNSARAPRDNPDAAPAKDGPAGGEPAMVGPPAKDELAENELAENESILEGGPATPDAGQAAVAEDQSTATGTEPLDGAVVADTPLVLNRLLALWDEQQRFTHSTVAARWPAHWAAVAQSLQRAETRILQDDAAAAHRILDFEVTPQLQVLRAANRDQQAGRAAQPVAEAIVEQALAQPTDDNLAALNEIHSVAAALLKQLGKTCRSDQQWRHPKAVELALITRRLAEQVGELDEPAILEFIREEVEAGDRSRREAEVALLADRVDAATQGLHVATGKYRWALTEATRLGSALQQVRAAALTAPATIAWLGAAPDASLDKSRHEEQVNQFFEQLSALAAEPTAARLLAAGRQGARLTEQTVQAAVDFQPTTADWRRGTAALQLTCLPVEVRRPILARLLAAADPVDLASGALSPPPSDSSAPVSQPYALYHLLNFLNGASDQSLLTTAQLGSFAALEPHAQRLSRGEPEVRRLSRAAATRDLQHVIHHILHQPAFLTARNNAWQQSLATLVASYWRGNVGVNLTARDAPANSLQGALERNRLGWELARLETDSRWLPGDVYRNTLNQRISEAERNGAHGKLRARQRRVQLVDEAPRNVQVEGAAGTVRAPFSARLLQDLPAGTRAKVVLEWPSDESRFGVLLDGVAQPDGRAEYPLPPQRGDYAIPLAIDVRRGEELPARLPIQARVEFLTGPMTASNQASPEVEWLPLQVHASPPPPPRPARLELSWDDRGVTPGRVDLYPNQSLPLRLAVEKLLPTPTDLKLEIQGDAATQVLPIETAPDQTGSIPIVPTTDLSVSLRDSLTLRLLDGDTLLETKTLPVAVLDLNQCFEHTVAYDPSNRMVRVDLERQQFSDSTASVPVELQLPGVPAAQGNLVGMLPADRMRVSLDAAIAADVAAPFRAAISVSDVPRVFRSILESTRWQGVIDEKLYLRVAAPRADATAAYSRESTSMPLDVQLDGSAEISFFAGMDRNRNGQLDPPEQQLSGRFWRGKQLQLDLVATAEPPGFSIRSRLGDVRKSLDVTGLIGAQTIVAKAVMGTQVAHTSTRVFVLRSAPPVRIITPSADSNVAATQPLELTVSGDRNLLAAIEQIEFAYDNNADGKFDDDELVTPLGVAEGQAVRFADRSALTVALPTTDLEPGSVTVFVRASSSVPDADAEDGRRQLVSEVAARAFQIRTTGRIVGRVQTPDGLPAAKAVVSLVGVGKKVLTDALGQFTLDAVLAGNHRLLAQTGDRLGAATVAVNAAQSTSVEITIRVY